MWLYEAKDVNGKNLFVAVYSIAAFDGNEIKALIAIDNSMGPI